MNSRCSVKRMAFEESIRCPIPLSKTVLLREKNRTLVDRARSMLNFKQLPTSFWAEAISTAVYISNISPTKALAHMTPYESWRGTKPKVSHLRIFGCLAFSRTPSPLLEKLDERVVKCIFIGYCVEAKAYKLYNPLTGKVLISRDVEFIEDAAWSWNSSEDSSQSVQSTVVPGFFQDRQSFHSNEQSPRSQNSAESSQQSNERSSSSLHEDQSIERQAQSETESTTPIRVRELRDIYESCSFALNVHDPQSFEEAQKSQEWRDAMKEELDAIHKNGTWELVDTPPEKKIIGLKWIFKTKFKANGQVLKHKARLVAKGYVQEYGVDYEDVFAPVARMDTVRLLLALAASKGWPVYHLDVKSAFLNGEINEDVYVEQPKGFSIPGKEGKVFKLKKALYGLKQAPRAWYSRINTHLLKQGFHKNPHEHTLYKKESMGGEILLICIYVDDIICLGSSLAMVQEFQEDMKLNFEMNDLGLMTYFLGLEVVQGSHGIHISQRRYTEDLLKSYNMHQCKPVPTPMNSSLKLQTQDWSGKTDAGTYRSLIGRLIYLTHSRPDISFSVGVLSRFMNSPTKYHMGAAKRILRYLGGTTSYGILYERGIVGKLEGYSDSDWAGCLDDRKSTSGVVFNLGSGAVTWSSKKQEITALSSTEAEYIALCSAACQGLWMKRILEDCGIQCFESIYVKCDNKSCIAIARNPVLHGRTKHIDVKFHFVHSLVTDGVIQLEHCNTEDQLADVLTKPLTIQKHVKMISLLGVCDLQSRGGVLSDKE